MSMYSEFAAELVAALSEKMPEKEFLLRDVEKNNRSLHGLIIREPGQDICPTLYLENYFDEYCENGIEPVAERIAGFVSELDQNRFTFDVATLENPDKVKEMLQCRLVRGDNNDKFLNERPHRSTDFGELVMYLNVADSEDQTAAIGVTHDIYRTYLEDSFENVDRAFDYAMENTVKRFPPKVKSMTSIIREIMAKQYGIDPDENQGLIEAIEQNGDNMYVVSNGSGIGGAVVLVYPENLQDISKSVFGGRDLVILPSSVHEAILVEPREGMGPRELLDMVKSVNREQVPPEEVLADDAFYYRAKTGEIVRASDMVKEMEKKKEKAKGHER